MKKCLLQILALLVLALAAFGLTWLVRGAPDRSVICGPEVLEKGEICLAEVPAEGVLWVDARSRAEFAQSAVPDAILLTDDRHENWDELLQQAAPEIVGAQMVVVYCNSKACGSSEAVAGKLREIGLGPEIRVLHGGWKALAAAGRTINAK